MEFSVYICDKNKISCNNNKDIINEYELYNSEPKLNLSGVYDCPIDLLKENMKEPCICMLAVDAENITINIEAAYEIQKKYKEAFVIIMTNNHEICNKIFEQNIIIDDFIIRRQDYDYRNRIYKKIAFIEEKYYLHNRGKLKYNCEKNNIGFINFSNIVSIDMGDYQHTVNIHEFSNNIVSTDAISKIYEQLPTYFYRLHRSAIINTIIRETHIKNMYWKPHSLTD